MGDSPEIYWGINYTDLSVYDRNLPHWRQEGAVYFVTFRLADSIPRSVIQDWQTDRLAWESAHGIQSQMPLEEQRRRLRSIPIGIRRTFEREQARKLFIKLDECHGACYLRRPDAADVVAKALRFFDGERIYCGDFVAMPNHIHWLLVPRAQYGLEAILQSVKRWTANQLNGLLDRRGSIWQKESFDHIVRNPEEFERIRAYIRENPAKAGLRANEAKLYLPDWG